VAVEVQGAGASRPWLEAAGATFPTVVDGANVLGETFGYRAIPNGIFLDESGRVRFQKLGGFSVHRPDDVAAIEALLGARTGSPAGSDHPDAGSAGAATGPADRGGRGTALARGLDRLRRGDREGALAAWREALAGDRENFVIRKQIWAVEYPERFYPTIDWAWQREQLARERAAEGRGAEGSRG
jgi:hypothetical protein